jgi:acetoin utilization deacetylase AcuC-like enzyme
MIFISCGFDAHYTDPVGNMKLDEKSFQRFTKLTMDIANKYCGGKIVSLLEGGYNTNTLRSNIRAHVETLMD